MSAYERWYERYEGRDDHMRVSVWMPTSLPSSRLQLHERGKNQEPVLADSQPIAYLTIAGVQIGGYLDDLELLLAAATEHLAETRAYCTKLQQSAGVS